MNWEDLIAIARALAAGAVSPQTGRPRRAELNRAVSTIYYAAFHTLANNNANTLIGSGSQARSDPAWELACRTIDHRSARARCQHPGMSRFPAQIREMAALFASLQARRRQADYAPQGKIPDPKSSSWRRRPRWPSEPLKRPTQPSGAHSPHTCPSGSGSTDGPYTGMPAPAGPGQNRGCRTPPGPAGPVDRRWQSEG